MGCLSILRARYESSPCSRVFCCTIAAVLLLTLAGSLYAQNKACEKTCQDKVNGPCSGETGKEFAQCLGNCMKACNPPPPPPPLLDPACSDRTMVTGETHPVHNREAECGGRPHNLPIAGAICSR